MNDRIEEKPGFCVVGAKETVSRENGGNFTRIPQIWQELHQSGMSEKIAALIETEPMGLLGVCANYNDTGNTIDYYVAATTTTQQPPAGMEKLEIKAGTWAIFESVGPLPDALQDTWRKIYTEWFPTAAYTHAGGAELEVYADGDVKSADYRCEVWIPVNHK